MNNFLSESSSDASLVEKNQYFGLNYFPIGYITFATGLVDVVIVELWLDFWLRANDRTCFDCRISSFDTGLVYLISNLILDFWLRENDRTYFDWRISCLDTGLVHLILNLIPDFWPGEKDRNYFYLKISIFWHWSSISHIKPHTRLVKNKDRTWRGLWLSTRGLLYI